MRLHQQIQITAELLGRQLSDLAVVALTKRLEAYPSEDVARALERCSQECRGALRLSDVLSRLPGAHVGADEAWAIACQAYDEGATVVWTEAISDAFGGVRHMDDRIAARMAFREAYERRLARAEPGPAQWWVSGGHDIGARELAIRNAAEHGRLPTTEVDRLLGEGRPAPRALPSGEPRGSDPVPLSEMRAFTEALRGAR